MLREMLHAKLHRATVTEANLDYVGSITIDADLLDAVDLLPNEKVLVVDVTNGARLETYTIAGERGSGVIGINGAAAHLVRKGDCVIIMSFVQLTDAEAHSHHPRVALLDESNSITRLLDGESHGPRP
ncbi:MAG: aspartate 1-decarboxylase [Candidatus Sumerlaeota bacterium]|nr:aspartate 1-decarboxylase [Candidatus Sumerlaeota bacterium]